MNKCDRIRERVSYQHYKKLFGELKADGFTNEQSKKIIQKVHTEVDDRNGYGSATNSNASEESIVQLFVDLQI
jgi:hypothetical protein